MYYRIDLADNTFFIVDENYELCIFKDVEKEPKRISVGEYLKHHFLYRNYYFVDSDIKSDTKVIVTFKITEIEYDNKTPLNIRLKYAKDIEVGDLLIGEDGTPRTVKTLHSGEEDLYKIIIKDTEYVVNGNHILRLVDTTTDEVLDIPVNVYVLMPDDFKSKYKMEKVIMRTLFKEQED